MLLGHSQIWEQESKIASAILITNFAKVIQLSQKSNPKYLNQQMSFLDSWLSFQKIITILHNISIALYTY